MAEIRKHNPRAGSDIGEQVRALMGETIRPIVPGSFRASWEPAGDDVDRVTGTDDELYDPFDQGEESAEPVEFTFEAAGDATIGQVPRAFISWVPDDGSATR